MKRFLSFLCLSLLVALSGSAALAQDAPSDVGVELTWVDGGGAYHDAVMKAWLDDYAARPGVIAENAWFRS